MRAFLSAEISFIYENLHTRSFEHAFKMLYNNTVSKSTTVQVWQLLNTKTIQKKFLMCLWIVMNNFCFCFPEHLSYLWIALANAEITRPSLSCSPTTSQSVCEPNSQPVPISRDVPGSQELDLPWCLWVPCPVCS